MKHLKKLLSLLLIACMALSMVAFATEEAPAAEVPAAVEESAAPEKTEVPAPAPEKEADPEPAAPAEQPAETPVETEEPAETEIPEVTEEPEVPAETEEPEATEEPEVPAETEEPEVTVEPEETEIPEEELDPDAEIILGDEEELPEVIDPNATVGVSKVTLSSKSATIGVVSNGYYDTVTVTGTEYFVGYDEPANIYPVGTVSDTKKVTLDISYGSIDYSTHTRTFTMTMGGVKTGTATIKMRTSLYGKTYASFKLTIKKAPKSLKLSTTKVTISEDQTKKVKATLSSGSASKYRYWWSSDDYVATVDQTGKITAHHEGTANIYCGTYNGVYNETKPCVVTVKPGPDWIKVGGKTWMGTMYKKQSFTIKPTSYDRYDNKVTLTSYKYSSSNPSVATVSSKGKVTAKAYGTTTITVTAHNGVSTSWQIHVGSAISKVKFSGAPSVMYVGDTLNMYEYVYIWYPANTDPDVDISFSSSKSSVIGVTDKAFGTITAKKPGTATITVKTANGKKATKKITVKALPTY